MRLQDKTAIVTGGTSGIGRSIAIRLAEEGANVVVADIDDKPSEESKPTHHKIQENGGNASFLQTDVRDESQVQDLVYITAEKHGEIDILVNNAGVHHSASVVDEDEENWQRIMDINLKGTYLCSKHVIDHMEKENIEGKIVNISSIAGIVGFPENAAYCASKGGVIELTKEMALDYGPEGININCVSPGVIKTSMTEDMLEDDKQRKFLESKTVASRLGNPEDIANAVVFLASDESDFIIGENLVVDGGWTTK